MDGHLGILDRTMRLDPTPPWLKPAKQTSESTSTFTNIGIEAKPVVSVTWIFVHSDIGMTRYGVSMP
jgi:hypothetical protein